MQSETESLLEKERRPSLEADPTLQHSSPKQEPPLLGPRGSYSAWGFFRSRPGGSFHSLRRVSSLDNFEAARSEFQRKFRERRANSGRGKTPELSVLLREPRSRAMVPARLGGEVSFFHCFSLCKVEISWDFLPKTCWSPCDSLRRQVLLFWVEPSMVLRVRRETA